MKLWAHRGCSQRFPENTLTAFSRAAALKGLTGIELDVQLTRDGALVVLHDERVDRTTDGAGEVRTFSLPELKRLKIDAGNGAVERVPTLEEVLDLLAEPVKGGLRLNIEFKNSAVPYEGLEEKVIDLVRRRGLERSVVYSTFSALSLERTRRLDPEAACGILDTKVSDCLYKLKGGCGADALHPFWRGIDLPPECLRGYPVRAWFTGHLYPERPTGKRLDLAALEALGITEVFLNEPERYLDGGEAAL